ncbi:MAG: ferrochelatase [Rhodospirillales bacterium]|nr:ferrochelatase [Rhodospirillales bacterium]
MSSRIAVVLFNLGGPDSPDAVRPFLKNLFSDPAILRMPGVFRWMLGNYISRARAPIARAIYDKIGGRSPIVEQTVAQANSLLNRLSEIHEDADIEIFISMRYWAPMVDEAVKKVKDFGPDQIVLVPLYPQFSSTTTASSFKSWDDAARKAGLEAPTARICCYPRDSGFVAAMAGFIRKGIDEASESGTPRVLFSAHGLPEKFVQAGDPYQQQVEMTVAAILAELGGDEPDYRICYQSRVGRLVWLGPYTDAEIIQAGQDQVPVVVVPVAFVSEHSETLVELDMEYAGLARENQVPAYVRAPTVGTSPEFIDGLAKLVGHAIDHGNGIISGQGHRICPADCLDCLLAETPAS